MARNSLFYCLLGSVGAILVRILVIFASGFLIFMSSSLSLACKETICRKAKAAYLKATEKVQSQENPSFWSKRERFYAYRDYQINCGQTEEFQKLFPVEKKEVKKPDWLLRFESFLESSFSSQADTTSAEETNEDG